MSNLQVLEHLNSSKEKKISIEMKTMRLCTTLMKHNLKINWLILQNEKRWAAASVRLPEEEVARLVEGQDSSYRPRREKKSCCLLASGDSQSLLH